MAYYDNIRLEKGMYGVSGKSFTQVLEELDPSDSYKGTDMEGLDSFQRQLKRYNIKVAGQDSNMVEKFFQTFESAALFPEYVARAIRMGIEEKNLLPSIVATTTKINGMDYRTITSDPASENLALSSVAQGEEIPETTISTKEKSVSLNKTGRMLKASYEALRFQKLDLFTVTLKQIGAHIAVSQFANALNVLVDGDGDENPAAVSYTETPGSITYADIVDFYAGFQPYELNTIVAAPDLFVKLLKIEEFKNPTIAQDFLKSGKLITPLGATLISSPNVATGTLIGLDKNYALEMVVASDVTVEYDKLIDRQLERAAITTISGFAKIFNDAGKILSTAADPQA